MKEISARIVADSVSPYGYRITSFVLCYPRFIHSELMTHRAFSRNAASSRAIPVQKMIAEVQNNPAGPIRWGTNGNGMQDHGEYTGIDAEKCRIEWLLAAEQAIKSAEKLNALGLHKQIVNRVLEPFTWMETLVTATDYHNFFALRCHKDAQPEFQRLAYLMLKLYINNKPEPKDFNEWHMPFGEYMPESMNSDNMLKIATARAARLSYKTFDGEMSVDKDLGIFDRLVGSVPGHWSPVEHPATPCVGRMGPYKGWCSYRAHFPNENIDDIDLTEHLRLYEQSSGVGVKI